MFRAYAGEDERALSSQQTFYSQSSPDEWNTYSTSSGGGYPSGGGDTAYSPPPMVSVTEPEGSSTSASDWFRMGKEVVGTFVNIFGQPVQQRQPVATTPPPSSGVPLWGWALIGIGSVAVLGFTIRSLKGPKSVAGHRRRRSRRSRR